MSSLKSITLTVAIGSATSLFLVGCQSETKPTTQPTAAKSEPATTNADLPGGIEIATVTTSFTIQSLDPANRAVTLKNEGGAVTTMKCGPNVRNYEQLRVGDTVRATVTKSLAINVRRADQSSPGVVVGQAMVRAPKGSTPKGMVVETTEITDRLTAVDPVNHTVTLQGMSGKPRTFSVDPSVDLSKVKVGDDVVISYAEALAISVEHNDAGR
jgi:hypothetical protein